MIKTREVHLFLYFKATCGHFNTCFLKIFFYKKSTEAIFLKILLKW